MALKPTADSKLIIVCGLPGSGKTIHARTLEETLGAVRFCPDEWMDALSLSLHDEEKRAQIEALQWAQAQRLLALGQTVVMEWGTWGRAERDALRQGARELGTVRVQRRGMEDPSLTCDDLVRSAAIFQAPTAEETALFDTYEAVGLEIGLK